MSIHLLSSMSFSFHSLCKNFPGVTLEIWKIQTGQMISSYRTTRAGSRMSLITAVWMNISARLRRFRAHLIRVSISLTISCRTFYISHTVAGDEICGAEMSESTILKNSLTIYRQKQTTSAEMSKLGSFFGLI